MTATSIIAAFESATFAYYETCFRLGTDFPPGGVAESQRRAEAVLFDSEDPDVDAYVRGEYCDAIERLRIMARDSVAA